MSWAQCRVYGCRNMVRTGLVRPHYGDGPPPADGETCWRCRRKQGTSKRAAKRPPFVVAPCASPPLLSGVCVECRRSPCECPGNWEEGLAALGGK